MCIHAVVVKHNPFIPSDFQNDTQFNFQLFRRDGEYFANSTTSWIYYILQTCDYDDDLDSTCQRTFSSIQVVSWQILCRYLPKNNAQIAVHFISPIFFFFLASIIPTKWGRLPSVWDSRPILATQD